MLSEIKSKYGFLIIGIMPFLIHIYSKEATALEAVKVYLPNIWIGILVLSILTAIATIMGSYEAKDYIRFVVGPLIIVISLLDPASSFPLFDTDSYTSINDVHEFLGCWAKGLALLVIAAVISTLSMLFLGESVFGKIAQNAIEKQKQRSYERQKRDIFDGPKPKE